MKLRRRTTLVVALIAVITMFTGVAIAASNLFNGGSLVQRVVRTDDVASTHSGTAFTNIPNATVAISVPTGATRLLTARFTAESQCTGQAGQYCTVRIVVRRNATGAVTEMFPQAGTDFAFDSVSTDNWESNSVARTIRVVAGSHTVLVQRRVTNLNTTARHDDWTLEVDVNG